MKIDIELGITQLNWYEFLTITTDCNTLLEKDNQLIIFNILSIENKLNPNVTFHFEELHQYRNGLYYQDFSKFINENV